MATYDETANVVQNQNLVDRTIQIRYRLDFSLVNSGSGLAATESAKIGEIPAGFIKTGCHPVLRTAEGVAATVDLGDATDPDGLLDGGDVNGTANAAIALAGTEAYADGKYYHTATDLEVLVPAAGATVDDAVVDFVLTGFLIPTT